MKFLILGLMALSLSLGCVSQSSLDAANAKNASLTEKAATLEDKVAELEESVSSLKVDLATSSNEVRNLQETVAELTNRAQAAEDESRAHVDENSELKVSLATLTQQQNTIQTTLETDLATTQAAYQASQKELVTAQTTLKAVEAKLATTESLLQQKVTELETLQNQPPYPEQLKTEVEELEKEIRQLSIEKRDHLDRLYELREEVPELEREAKRLEKDVEFYQKTLDEVKDLIRDYDNFVWTLPILCSGSMEPRIGCTDRAVLELNPDPATIEVGQVIVFKPPPAAECPKLPTGGILHRVEAKWTQVEEGGRINYFRTRGDYNDYADEVSIPSSHVCARLMAVDQDYYPGMAEIRKEALDALHFMWAERDSYHAAVDDARAAGLVFTRNCTYSAELQIFFCYDVASARSQAQEFLDAYDRLDPYFKDWERAVESYKEKIAEGRTIFKELYGLG